ncbi:MAG: Hsp20/alpha crystallin family protein [Terracidiphilus sp.]
MEASAAKTTPNQMGMGRPSDETLAEDDDERCIRSRIVPDDFGSFEKGPSIRILEDWLKHEAELLRPIHIILSESSDALSVRADVPGVAEGELKIKEEPARVMITRRPEMKSRSETIYSRSSPDESMRVIDLPNAVTVNKIRIAVREGVLELDLTKAEPAKQQGIEVKAT